jgi:hypothetical protein
VRQRDGWVSLDVMSMGLSSFPFISRSLKTLMTYSLSKLASGSYDLYLDGSLMGGVVRNGPSARTWSAELLRNEPDNGMPKPFTKPEHRFESFGAVLDWLGGAKVEGDRSNV